MVDSPNGFVRRLGDARPGKPEALGPPPFREPGRASVEGWLEGEHLRGDVRFSVMTAQEPLDALSSRFADRRNGVALVILLLLKSPTPSMSTQVTTLPRISVRACAGGWPAYFVHSQTSERVISAGNPSDCRVFVLSDIADSLSRPPQRKQALEGRRGRNERPTGQLGPVYSAWIGRTSSQPFRCGERRGVTATRVEPRRAWAAFWRRSQRRCAPMVPRGSSPD